MLPPYMIQLCQRLFHMNQSSEEGEIFTFVCTNWFHQAFDHCSALLMRKPGCQRLWNKLMTLKHFIFPDQESSLVSTRMPISIHPDLLSPSNCQELATQVIRDYLHYIPRYTALLNENHCLWLILRSIFGVTIIILCVIIMARRYNALQRALPQVQSYPKPLLSLRDRLLTKNFKRVMYETKYLSVVPVMNPQLLQCGCPVLGLKISAKKFCDIQAILTKPPRLESASDAENSSTQASERLKSFFQNSGQYRLVLSLELDCGDDEGVLKITQPSSHKSSGIPIHKPARRIGIRRRL